MSTRCQQRLFFSTLFTVHQFPISVKGHVENHLHCKVTGFRPASGGCINHGGELVTDKGSYFLKWNDAHRYTGMFGAESKGLTLLDSAKCIHIPKVVLVDEVEDKQFIVMEFVRAAHPKKNYWALLGERLAQLHRNTNTQFGLDHDNYIGSLHQSNFFHKDWIQFFIEQRLDKQVSLAERNSRMEKGQRSRFATLYKKLPELLPAENPALLHGDLWSGNVMVNEKGEPCLIDPAVYFGHREIELAFTRLFGGFGSEFYEAYVASFPLLPGFTDRVDIYNLYPLMVHVNLFGGGYLQQAERILKRYT